MSTWGIYYYYAAFVRLCAILLHLQYLSGLQEWVLYFTHDTYCLWVICGSIYHSLFILRFRFKDQLLSETCSPCGRTWQVKAKFHDVTHTSAVEWYVLLHSHVIGQRHISVLILSVVKRYAFPQVGDTTNILAPGVVYMSLLWKGGNYLKE